MVNKRILLVEDDFMNMRLAKYILEVEGYTVLTVATAQEALEQIESSVPDLLLMDMQLPDMDGMTVVRILRQRVATRDMTILALTACAMKGDRERILQNFVNTVKRFLNERNRTKTNEKGACYR